MSDPAPSQRSAEKRQLYEYPEGTFTPEEREEMDCKHFAQLTPVEFAEWLAKDAPSLEGKGVELTHEQTEAYLRWLETGEI